MTFAKRGPLTPFSKGRRNRLVFFAILLAFLTLIAVYQPQNAANSPLDPEWRTHRGRPMKHPKPELITDSRPPPPPPPPPELPPKIPKKLWYKYGDRGLTPLTREWTASCIMKNVHYEVNIANEVSADAYVQRKFGKRHPELVAFYMDLPFPILKADIFRLLALYSEGGIYLDLDVSCNTPFDTWIPPAMRKAVDGRGPNLVLGWEFDYGYPDNIIPQLASWTIMAAPGSPHLWRTVTDIFARMRETVVRNNISSFGELTLEMIGSVIDATGPQRLTLSVLESVKEGMLAQGRSKVEVEGELKGLRRIMEPRMIGDMLIMPGWAWARSMQRWEEWEKMGGVVPESLAVHHYAGSWKNQFGGEI